MTFIERSEKRDPQKKSFFQTTMQQIINDKLIASKLDEYKVKYDMYNFYEWNKKKKSIWRKR